MSITTEAREVLEKAQEDVFDIHGIYGLGDIRKALKYGKAALDVVDAAGEVGGVAPKTFGETWAIYGLMNALAAFRKATGGE